MVEDKPFLGHDYGLATKLKLSHESLLKVMDEIKSVVRNYGQVKPRLADLYDFLLKHFSLQGKPLYESMERFSAKDHAQAKMLEFLQQNLVEIKVRALTFMDAHPATATDIHAGNFISDFNQISVEILARIRSEQQYLIPMISRLTAHEKTS